MFWPYLEQTTDSLRLAVPQHPRRCSSLSPVIQCICRCHPWLVACCGSDDFMAMTYDFLEPSSMAGNVLSLRFRGVGLLLCRHVLCLVLDSLWTAYVTRCGSYICVAFCRTDILLCSYGCRFYVMVSTFDYCRMHIHCYTLHLRSGLTHK